MKAKKSMIKKGLAIPIRRFVAGNSVRCVICDLEPKLQYGDVFSCVNVSGFNSLYPDSNTKSRIKVQTVPVLYLS